MNFELYNLINLNLTQSPRTQPTFREIRLGWI